MNDRLSWWATTPREAFASVAEARIFAPVNSLHRAQKVAHDYAKPATDGRGKHKRYASEDKTVCAVCPTALTHTEQSHGVRRCRDCRKTNRTAA